MPGNQPIRCVILGGGGHARVVIDALRVSEAAVPHAVLDADQRLWGTRLLEVPVRGGDDLIDVMKREGVTHFVMGLGGVGDNAPRQCLFDATLRAGLQPLTICHPSAVCSPAATIGEGSMIFALAVINAGAALGRNVIVNTGAIVEHDCIIEDHAHVATGARLCGAVRVGRSAHIGAGATVRQSCIIGEGAVVGAHALVLEAVASRTVVAGVPAHPRFSRSRKVMA